MALLPSFITNIPNNADPENVTHENLLTSYGTVTYNRICNHVASYSNPPQRDAQDSQFMYHCIMASLSKECKSRIILHKHKYMHRGLPSGPMLLKILIQETCMDSQVTTRHIRENLGKLDTYMVSIGSDINKFNDHVLSLLGSLAAHGETTQDLLTNLFKGYKAATDSAFTAYIQHKEEESNDGNAITPNSLMSFARNKFVTLTTEGKWNAMSVTDTKLVAMRAEINRLKSPHSNSNAKRHSNQDKPRKHKPDTTNSKNTNNSNKKGRVHRKPADWAKEPPTDGQPRTCTVNNRLYHWCMHHKQWVMHNPKECLLAKKSQGTQNSGGQPQTLKLGRALSNIAVSQGFDL